MSREKIFIVPNGYGLMYAAGIFVTLLVGAIYSNNLVFLLCFFLVSLFLIGLHQTHSNLKNLSLDGVEFTVTEAGKLGKGKLWIKAKDHLAHNQIFIHDRKKKYFAKVVDQIPENSLAVAYFSFSLPQRGVYPIDQLVLSTRFPFGLFYAWKVIELQTSIFVSPRAAGELDFPEIESLGESLERIRGTKGEDFSGHRNYQPGESQRHIDWKALARGRPLLVKEFDSGQQGVVRLNTKGPEATKEVRLSQISKWIIDCEEKHIPYSLELENKMLETGLGKKHQQLCMQCLAGE